MSRTRAITPFVASVPGIDDRILRDVGLDAEGNLLDNDDPRVQRVALRKSFVEQLLHALLRLRGSTPREPQVV